MAIKLVRIRIQNFKLFEDYLVEFNSSNLVVFDGPNGFGKTSFYDAIELLFTGYLRRYTDLIGKVVDKRHVSLGCPLLYDQAADDLVIKGELDVDGNTVCLLRRGARDDLLMMAHTDKPELKLYKGDNFDGDEFALITDENNFLTELLGKNYVINFEFLNYIEQEENIHLLKNKNKGRKDAIAHLFNTLEFDERINQLKDASKKIGKLCAKDAKESLCGMKEKLDESRSKLSGDHSSLPFATLIPWKDIGWDAKNLEFPDGQYVEWLGEGGELDKIECFLGNVDDFKKHQKNTALDKLLSDERLALEFLLCWNFIDSAKELNQKLALKKSIDVLLQSFERGVIDAISNNKIGLAPGIREIIKSVVDADSYSDLVTEIFNAHRNANSLSQLLIDVKDSRESFIRKYRKYEAATNPDKSCPLCGYSWHDADEMTAKFDTQAGLLEQLIKASGTEVNLKLDKLVNNYIVPIQVRLEEYIIKEPVDERFVNKLNYAVNNHINLAALNGQLTALSIDVRPLLNNRPIVSEEIDIKQLQSMVDEKKFVLKPGGIHAYFGTIFLQVFDENYENVYSIDASAIVLKRKYIEWRHSLHQSAHIQKLLKEYEEQKRLLDNAALAKKKIDNLKKIYENSLKEYQKNLIENIEILFHIYSGRIAQESKGGLGLFIDADKNGIRFLENNSKQHDAIFTMSSGQLATLVIAFTLALNKRYSSNKILFIDDPIQTLDELNIAGLVELLRNEFSDRQIFISTHEDIMSTYMRYKFKKYGLGAQRLSFKQSQLAPN